MKLPRWISVALLMTGLLGSLGPAALGATPPKPLLEFTLRFWGFGSWPDPDAEPSSQQWILDHIYQGQISTLNEPETVMTPSGPRTQLAIRWNAEGHSRLEGSINDRADNMTTEFGEGGSTSVYKATELWSASADLPVSAPLLNLYLDTERGVWNGNLGFGVVKRSLEDAIQYSGTVSVTPGADGGAGFEGFRSFTTTDPESRQVYTRYHPRFPPSGDLRLVDVPALLQDGVYRGRLDVDIPKPIGISGTWVMKANLEWKLVDPLPDVELTVSGLGYADWRPTLGANMAPGAPLILAAALQSPTGESLERIRIRKMTWTLNETSREPGVAMNFPARESAKADPDLRIEGVPTTDDGQKAEVVPEAGDLGSVIDVVPYDWGGWSTLRVQAELEDGRVIEGKMDLGRGEKRSDIPIPRREDGSKVAVAWLREHGLSGAADLLDDDAQPVGKPGADGDGLTVYEEYRGFYVEGEHRSTDPARKDLFVLNRGQTLGLAAVGRFRRISQLEVHIPSVTEFDPFVLNQINFNRGQGPSRGPQGGLHLVKMKEFRGNHTAATRPGTHGRVGVPKALPMVPSRLRNRTTAEHIAVQEMFRALGVERPGPDDSIRVFLLRIPPVGSADPPEIIMVDSNTRVVVLDFFGEDYARKMAQQIAGPLQRIPHRVPAGTSEAAAASLSQSQVGALTRLRWLVGEKGGAHSGPENCVMRDWFADVYRSRFNAPDGRPIYRLIDPVRGPESPGTRLGTGRIGTGVNAPDRQPEPRYGDSKVSAPANRQMVVRDSAP